MTATNAARRARSGAPALVLLALTACSQSDAASSLAIGHEAQPIVTPTGDPATPAVLAVEGLFLCTGTLVAPRVVVTAAHCLSDVPPSVAFGSSIQSPARRVGVLRAVRARTFDRETLADDVAVLLLAEPAPAEIAPAPLRRTDLAGAVGTLVRVSGFGATNDSGTPDALRVGTARIAALAPTRLTLTPAPSLTCSGDSGGPVFVGGELAGVVSSGDCATTTTATRVDAFVASFLDPFMAATREGAASIGARCDYPRACAAGLTCRTDPGARFGYCTRACDSDAACPPGARCEPAPSPVCAFSGPAPGSQGGACDFDEDCTLGDCDLESGRGVCRARCAAGPASADGCAPVDAGDRQPAANAPPSTSGGGCRTTPGSRSGGLLFLIVVVAWAAALRRRTAPPRRRTAGGPNGGRAIEVARRRCGGGADA